jgi:hypothetical protein
LEGASLNGANLQGASRWQRSYFLFCSSSSKVLVWN